MKEVRCMLISELVVLVVDIVTVERVNNTNNKVVIDVENNSNGDWKENLPCSISNLVVFSGKSSWFCIQEVLFCQAEVY